MAFTRDDLGQLIRQGEAGTSFFLADHILLALFPRQAEADPIRQLKSWARDQRCAIAPLHGRRLVRFTRL